MADKIQRPYKGLYMDSSYVDQPKETYSFALNAVSESLEGDQHKISFEQSNELSVNLPDGFTPLNFTYMGQNTFCVFLSNDVTSIIGTVNLNTKKYVEIVSSIDLNFRTDKPIRAVYRLRRGCEKTVYFVDDFNLPRYFNFSSLEDFKTNQNWDVDKFSLIKSYNSIPTYKKIEIQEAGSLKAGSYNFAIQYLDEDLNPTEWLAVSDTIIIYHDNLNEQSYETVRGSTNKITPYQDFGPTSKNIRLELEDLDTNYTYYRIAVIEATNASGLVSAVSYTQEFSTRQKEFSYTGNNAIFQGSTEEILQFNDYIASAKDILQIENRLLLVNTKGASLNFCNLQKYASKIKGDLVTKEVLLGTKASESNQKQGQLHMFGGLDNTNSVGYMPGEIYSFGIVYLFKNGFQSPVYHIPGKAPTDTLNRMSSNNTLENTTYIDQNSCNSVSYWGRDYQGDVLEGTPIRHHRFPTRKELGEIDSSKDYNIVKTEDTDFTESILHTLILSEGEGSSDPVADIIYVKVYYDVGGETRNSGTITLDLTNYDLNQIPNFEVNVGVSSETISNVIIKELTFPSGNTPVESNPNSGLVYNTRIEERKITDGSKVRTSEIFGINFSNIEIPTKEELGHEIIGYYIVQNERREEDKTVLDTGLALPIAEFENFQGVGMLNPNGTSDFGVQSDNLKSNFSTVVDNKYALFHPENAFHKKEYTGAKIEFNSLLNLSTIVEENNTEIQDAQPGTSYNPERHKKAERDTDGYTLQVLNRKQSVESYIGNNLNLYTPELKNFLEGVTDINYLNPLYSFSKNEGGEIKNIFNLSADNRFAIVDSDSLCPTIDYTHVDSEISKIPVINHSFVGYMVTLKKDLSDPYSNFRTSPYYKASKNVHSPGENSVDIFSGDSYISSMTMTSSVFHDVKVRERATRSGLFKIIVGVVLVVAAVAASIFTFGAATPLLTGAVGAAAALTATGLGIAVASQGFKVEKMREVYGILYEEGLRNVVHDFLTRRYFQNNPEDDSIQWMSDVIENIYFESSVNMNWRIGSSGNQIPDFADSPNVYGTGYHVDRIIDKLTVVDSENDSGRLYQGFANSEIYELNLDYLRRNREKVFTHLPLEYDCCSDCQEEFPHRYHFTEQSFQEELTDNYRTILPLSYRDLSGETGPITSISKLRDSLFLHTEDGFWSVPKNLQERVTDEVVSFIGTGSFFSVPPKKIVDADTNNGSGAQHQSGVLKTPFGLVMVSENEKGIYLFNGNNIKDLTLKGLSNWFKNNLEIQVDTLFQNQSQFKYPYSDNPFHSKGVGYCLGYDPRKKRLLITKKDFIITNPEILGAEDLYIGFEQEQAYFISNVKEELDSLNVGETYKWSISRTKGKSVFISREIYVNGDFSIQTGEIVGNPISLTYLENSWTITYNFKKESWESFMSYRPNSYITSGDEFYTLNTDLNSIWRQNVKGKFNSFYGVNYHTIVEYVHKKSPLTSVYNAIALYTEARKYDIDTNSFVEINETFNKAILYNSTQCTGELILIPKGNAASSWFTKDNALASNEITIDRNEKDWSINELRDIRVDHTKPMWNKDKTALDGDFKDKVLNTSTLDFGKDWQQMESLRDKYLVVRLIFDNFDDVNILLNYSVSDESVSKS